LLCKKVLQGKPRERALSPTGHMIDNPKYFRYFLYYCYVIYGISLLPKAKGTKQAALLKRLFPIPPVREQGAVYFNPNTMKTTVSRQLKLLLIDDEKEACTQLRHIIEDFRDPAITIAGMAHNTIQAEALIAQTQPDAVLIDIEMPEENAFQFLERIAPHGFKVIFVTAYDAFAVRAFRLNAVDYILKPVNPDEVRTALERVKAGGVPEEPAFYQAVSAQLSEKSVSKRIRLRSGNHLDIVDIADLYCIEAQRAYCKIYFQVNGQDKTIIMSRSLTDYAEMLPTRLFYRVHKSYLVNCSHVAHLITSPEPAVVLRNGIKVPVSRRRYTPLLSFLSDNHFQATKAIYR